MVSKIIRGILTVLIMFSLRVVLFGGVLWIANYLATTLFGFPMLSFVQLCGIVAILTLIKVVIQ